MCDAMRCVALRCVALRCDADGENDNGAAGVEGDARVSLLNS